MAEGKGIEGLIRSALASLGSYSPHKSPDTLKGKVEVPAESIIKLDANENPYGCSPKVKQALASYPNFSVYPDAGQTELRQLLAGYTGIGAENIVAGSGSGDLIDLILRLFVEPGDEVINCPPTFDLYRFETGISNGTLVQVPRDKDFAVDVSAVGAAIGSKTKLIFLSNPNNPTGTLTPREDILKILDSGLAVVVDEAYYEFSGETVLPLFSQYQNLMVLRTFSKWAGLAGLRVGYGIFPPKIADWLLKIKLPYNVNVAALVAVRESLGDIDYLKGRIKAIIDERERLFKELQGLKFLRPLPSRANFILCEVADGKAKKLYQKLQDRGILVRCFDTPHLENFIRISVGKPEHTDALIRTLKQLGEE